MSNPQRRKEREEQYERERLERSRRESEEQTRRDTSTLYCLVDELVDLGADDLLKYILHRIIAEAGIE